MKTDRPLHKRRAIASFRAACLFSLAVSAPAQGQPAVTPASAADPCEAVLQCMLHAEQARALARSGKLAEAAAEYQAAYAQAPAPWLLYNRARKLHSAGRLDEAAQSYEQYLETGTAENPEQCSKAREYLAQIRRSAAAGTATGTAPNPAQRSLRSPPALSSLGLPQPVKGAPGRDSSPHSAVHKKWWFWTVLGLAAVGTGTAIGLAAYASAGPDGTGLTTIRPFAN